MVCGLNELIEKNQIPLVLAGPILRRVEPTSVTVWVALRDARKVTLNIYESEKEHKGESLKLRGERNTVKLGKYLHIAAVTADKGSEPLHWGSTYFYNLTFDLIEKNSVENPNNGSDLFAPKVVSIEDDHNEAIKIASKLLTYDNGPTLPSFALPSEDLTKLRIIHGSCRKPHDAGRDALSFLDNIIESSLSEKKERPNILFLTGDQIYADDVASCLLHMLIEAGKCIIPEWNEELPDIKDPKVTAADKAPGTRKDLVQGWAKFTSGESDNHLLSFSDYCMMYLFVWSDVLWPSQELLPTFDRVFGEKSEKKLKEHTYGSIPGINRDSETKCVKTKEYIIFEKEKKAIKSFFETLPNVRRALANIPSYMIFDDHEVTDDWYIHAKWSKDVLSTKLGQYIIRNALLGYALFQAWGNTPDQFKSDTNGGKLLDVLEVEGEAKLKDENLKKYLDLPSESALMGASEGNHLKYLPRSENGINWHYKITGPNFDAIVLNTRTMRSFPSKRDRDPPALIPAEPQLMDMQVKFQPEKKINFVVSGAPFLGVPFTEVAQKLATIFGYETVVDAEAWSLNSHAFQLFLSKVSERKRVIILSGDVHYGFASRAFFWGDKLYLQGDLPQESRKSVFAQLVASPLKYEKKTPSFLENIHTIGYRLFGNKPTNEIYIGYGQKQPNAIKLGTEPYTSTASGGFQSCLQNYSFASKYPILLNREPAVLRCDNLPPGSQIDIKPDWMYEIQFLKGKKIRKPVIDYSEILNTDQNLQLETAIKAAKNHLAFLTQDGGGTETVARNNLGDITLKVSTGGEITLIQEVWWLLSNATKDTQVTRYEVSLSPPSEPMPWNKCA